MNNFEIQDKLCYVTAYLNIGRDSWSEFGRSFEKYFEAFTRLVNMFNRIEDKIKDNLKCVICNKKAKHLVYVAKSY